MIPRFVVASTGRSGSTYIAEVLTKSGIPCGHEEHWMPDRTAPRTPGGPIGDSSWFAIPEIIGSPDAASDRPEFVFHQVRDPLKTIGSLLTVLESKAVPVWNEHRRRTMEQFTPGMTGDNLIDAARIWVHWNSLIELTEPDYQWQVETFRLYDIRRIAEIIGHDLDEDRAILALEAVPRDTNSLGKRDLIYLGDLPSEWWSRVARKAQGYGYRY